MQDCSWTLQLFAGMIEIAIKMWKGRKIYEKNTDFGMGPGGMPCSI